MADAASGWRNHPALRSRPWLGRWPFLLLIAAALGYGLIVWRYSGDRSGPLVVYCALDARYAEPILRDFEKRSGVAVETHFNPDPKKPFDPAEVLGREKDAPPCDVLWNDELIGTLDLQHRELLEPYQSPAAARIPIDFKAADGSWTGFAARVRVIIANTSKIGTTPPNLDDLLPGSDRSRIAMARPLAGSTLTHYAALWRLWGDERLKAWDRDWQIGKMQRCDDNAAVSTAVGDGVAFAGYTDSDAFFATKDAGKPVAMYPVRLESGRTIIIPNTVAIMRRTKRPTAARQLVDFLLSEETELALARSQARLIPLGPVPAAQLPEELREAVAWTKDPVDLKSLDSARAECLAWLKTKPAP